MGYLIGGRIVNTDRYGKSKNINQNQGLIKVPEFKPIRGASFDKSQDFKARIRTQAADISRTAPTFNDPRYTFTTLSIPTDLRTLNGLYRFFDDTDPIVGNAIRLHTEFPLAGYGFSTCGDPGIQAHFEEMWDRIHGDQLLFDLGLEYWRIGNVFLFGAWNEVDFMWDQFAVLNPDYVTVESTWLNQKPLIKLQPDEALKRIVSSGQPKFLYNQLSPEIIKFVRLGQEIPLDPNNTFFIAHNKAPYENLGKSIIKRILKMLIYEDRLNMANFSIATRQVIPITVVKLGDPASGWIPGQEEMEDVKELFSAREVDPNFCYDDQTECLTDKGWVKYDELTYNHKVASFNKENNSLEYYNPSIITIQDYEGDMIHFKTKHVDIKVTPNHRMLVNRDEEWQIVHAENVRATDRFRACVDNYEGEKPPKMLEIAGEQVNSEAWFEFVGWWLAEGCLCYHSHTEPYSVNITQSKVEGVQILENLSKRLPWNVRKNEDHFVINNVKLGRYLKETCSEKINKHVPRWMLNADKKHLDLLLKAWLQGDGTCIKQKNSILWEGASVSKQLIDDMQEIALKLGYGTFLRTRSSHSYLLKEGKRCYNREDGTPYYDLYMLSVSETVEKKFPLIPNENEKTPIDLSEVEIYRKKKQIDWDKIDLESLLEKVNGNVRTLATKLGINHVLIWNQIKNRKIEIQKDPNKKIVDGNELTCTKIQREFYKGKIWCVSVPTGIIITRRGGEIAVQGQTIFYHYGLDIQFYGASGKILNLTPEHDRIRKLKFLGLGISEALLSGGTATYATAYMNLEVLRQRYLHFQLRLENFVHKGLFEVVSRLCGFYQTDKTVVGKNYKGKVYGDAKAMKNFMEQRFAQKTLRDLQDNFEFKEFIRKKAQEDAENGLAVRPKYIYPKMKWDLLSLTSDAQYRQFLMSFDKMFPGVRKISDATYYRVLKLDGDLEQRQIEVEKQEQRNQQFKDAKKDKEFREKLISEGLELPPTQQVKPLGGGGPTLLGGPLPPSAPRAPIGKGVAEGEGKPGGGPEVLREKSKEMQEELEGGLEAEVKRLKKSNKEMLKNRDTEN